ncbi:MAG: hypothetical protein ACTSPQ_22625 [Candidatus Helarchaeota archaeon]
MINYFLYYIGDPILWSRFAEIMRKYVEDNKNLNNVGNILRIAKNTLNWELLKIEPKIINRLEYSWKIRWYNYVSVASYIMDENWRLVNNYIENGWIFLITAKVKRLIAEKIRNDIFSKSKDRPRHIPNDVYEKIKDIMTDLKTLKAKYEELSGVVSSEVRKKAFPPCINYLLSKAKSGTNLAHFERLILVFFLLNIGMTIDEVLDIFKLQPDFDENRAKYYIEHAAGRVGGRTRYKPYNCIKIQSFEGICQKTQDPKKWCTRTSGNIIKNPIQYYSKMIWTISNSIKCPNCGFTIYKNKLKDKKEKICPKCQEDISDLIQE